VSNDPELETWRREWRDPDEPLPNLKRKIKRQNLRTVAATIAMCVLLAITTVQALRTRGSFVSGMATGLWTVSLVAGSYAWWVRRGAWRPAAQTTLAYAELAHKRAVAKVRTLRFSFYFLLTAMAVCTAFSAWNWRTLSPRSVLMWAVLLAAMVAELFYFRHYARRKQREVEETRKLIEQIRQ
jgi:hypothetical protein